MSAARDPGREGSTTAGAPRLVAGLALLFAALVGLRLHGFSLAAWHEVIDGSAPSEILLGSVRDVRWDDWVVQLPLALAQVAHDPPYPLVNGDVGEGQNMLVPIAAPVWHPLALFRPTLWGFFLGRDVGIAWLWWSQVLGLLAVWTLVFRVLARGRLGLAFACALVLVLSPLFQFFCFNAAPFAIYAGLAWLATVGLLGARRPRSLLASGVLLGWSGACFALATYPPFQVPLAHLYLVLLGGFVWQRRRELDLRAELPARALGLGLALAIAAAAVAWFWIEARDAIALLRDTEYPGHRVARAGDRPFWHLVNPNFLIPLQVSDLGPLGRHISTSASFWITWPVVAAAALWRAATRRERPDALVLGLAAYCAVLSIYCAWGLPEGLARASLLSAVPASRAVLGLGLGDALLLAAFLGSPPPARRAGRRADLAFALAWTGALAVCAVSLRAALPEARPLWLGLLLVANGALALAILRRARPALAVGAIAALLAACTAWFNPLARGGSDYLLHNPVSELILDLDRRAGGRSTWVSYGDPKIPNLFRVLGVRALDGVQPVPQLALWERIDPAGAWRAHYNRFAHVHVKLPTNGMRLRAMLDTVAVELAPDGGDLERLGATHVLVRDGSPLRSARFADYEPIGRAGPYAAYALPLRKAPRHDPAR